MEWTQVSVSLCLRSLVTEIALGKEDVAARFRNCGQMKLIIVSGIFLDESDSDSIFFGG